MKFFGASNLILLAIFLQACGNIGPNETPLQLTPKNLPSAEMLSELSFEGISQSVFVPKCISCHGDSGNVNLETYSEVFKNISLIKKSVFVDKTMPKRGSLSKEQLDLLWNWIEAGAPERPQNGTPPILEPLIATYDSINKLVFQTSCKDCHNASGSGRRISLEKEDLLNSPLELVLPGNPDESGLTVAIERADNKRMPPEKEGYAPLSDETKLIIRKWIENGAKD